MEVGQPSLAPAGSPLDGEYDEIEGVGRLHLQPSRAPPAGRVWRVEVLDHHAFVPLLQGGYEELLRRCPGPK